jgi:hypothetical protein
MIRFIVLLFILCVVSLSVNSKEALFEGGHVKYLFLYSEFDENSFFYNFVGSSSTDHNADARLKFNWKNDQFNLVADYQLTAAHGDGIYLGNVLPASVLNRNASISDANRLFDLTHTLSSDSNDLLIHRIDRLYMDITTRSIVARFGRQAVSWGNGLIYAAMDFFNPFDPSAIDKEYKTGDDMLYGQILMQNNDDIQAVWVVRRDNNFNVTDDVDSMAIKYHGFSNEREFDLLVATHYDDTIYAAGGIVNVGEAIWRGDITLTDTGDKNVTSLVTSLSYSWISWGHNVSGVVEYFYNGFGRKDKDYRLTTLVSDRDLIERIARGELFTLARHYIALSALIEVTPLWTLTPNAFVNLDDHSFLAQLVSTYDVKQDWQLLVSLSVPMGSTGSEFAGVDSGVAGRPLSTDLSLFAQLAWYF